LGFGRRDGFAGIVLNISFFNATEEGGTFSFYRKICKLAPILISGKFDKYFTFMPLALCDGTTAQLQICSSERNVPLLPVDWKTISKRMMSANPVCGTNIKAPEPAVKGTPQKQLRIP
jgi:hypothetical protein